MISCTIFAGKGPNRHNLFNSFSEPHHLIIWRDKQTGTQVFRVSQPPFLSQQCRLILDSFCKVYFWENPKKIAVFIHILVVRELKRTPKKEWKMQFLLFFQWNFFKKNCRKFLYLETMQWSIGVKLIWLDFILFLKGRNFSKLSWQATLQV